MTPGHSPVRGTTAPRVRAGRPHRRTQDLRRRRRRTHCRAAPTRSRRRQWPGRVPRSRSPPRPSPIAAPAQQPTAAEPDRRADTSADRELEQCFAQPRRARDALRGGRTGESEHHHGRHDPVIEAALHGDQPPDPGRHHAVGHYRHAQCRVGWCQRRADQQREPQTHSREQQVANPSPQAHSAAARWPAAGGSGPVATEVLHAHSRSVRESTQTKVTSTRGLSVSGAR